MIQRVFTYLNYSQIINMGLLTKADTGFFIRNQNFTTQQNTSGTVRVWAKFASSSPRLHIKNRTMLTYHEWFPQVPSKNVMVEELCSNLFPADLRTIKAN